MAIVLLDILVIFVLKHEVLKNGRRNWEGGLPLSSPFFLTHAHGILFRIFYTDKILVNYLQIVPWVFLCSLRFKNVIKCNQFIPLWLSLALHDFQKSQKRSALGKNIKSNKII